MLMGVLIPQVILDSNSRHIINVFRHAADKLYYECDIDLIQQILHVCSLLYR